MSNVTVEELRTISVFEDLRADQLEWLASHGEVAEFDAGATVFEINQAAEHMVAILEGAVEIVFVVGGQLVPSFTQRAGMVSGRLPFSRMRTFTASGRAVDRTRLWRLHQSHFDECCAWRRFWAHAWYR